MVAGVTTSTAFVSAGAALDAGMLVDEAAAWFISHQYGLVKKIVKNIISETWEENDCDLVESISDY